ncbi:SMI1/KNR4 family protein [Brevibacillus brevis]|uniref:SMI1/KNR4 family protein n=1 Tax=Brevibacillus brevis TaxID=1393 RepID=UPI0007D8B1D6|nr:SMI1/KNR4 family protein [Brevibacillus brevis]
MKLDIIPILDSLKERVSKGYTLIQEEYTGDLIDVEFRWNNPASKEEIESFTEKTGWVFPESYKKFLSIHNGAILFMSETHQFCLHTIKEVEKYYNEFQVSRDKKTYPPNWYHMATFYGYGEYMFIDSEKVKNGREDYIIIVGVGVISELPINFETWLDRIILSQGNRFWSWDNRIE